MALAFLFNRLRELDPNFRIADSNLNYKIKAFVVDHRLRAESSREASAVATQLNRMKHITAEVLAINWAKDLRHDQSVDLENRNPAELPNVESIARRLRYRRIGAQCQNCGVMSLFTAHHQDDQYETVLMRLLNGHGSRGLRGMLPAANIPECHDMHGVYESGLLDDQLRKRPALGFAPRRRDRRSIRREMRSQIDLPTYMAELRAGQQTDLDIAYFDEEYEYETRTGTGTGTRTRTRTAVPPIPTEDAGVMLYRPLLPFGKDRLVATCEANGVAWFEDATNRDPTLTMRNAVRWTCAHHQLPAALQKPSVLRLSRNCLARSRAHDAEAERWLRKMRIHDFDPNAGTLVVGLPDLALPSSPPWNGRTGTRRWRYSRRRRELRLVHRRVIAALLVRRLLAFVTPDHHLPQIASLRSPIARLFPSIGDPAELARLDKEPKPFNQGSVLFIPLPSASSSSSSTSSSPSTTSSPPKWFLTRQPYPSSKPLPSLSSIQNDHFPGSFVFLTSPSTQPRPEMPWRRWNKWRLFDGRFWVRIRTRHKGLLRVAPFHPAHAKDFRDGLDPPGRDLLADVLRRYAPGKVRYTLPALYSVESWPERDSPGPLPGPLPRSTPRQRGGGGGTTSGGWLHASSGDGEGKDTTPSSTTSSTTSTTSSGGGGGSSSNNNDGPQQPSKGEKRPQKHASPVLEGIDIWRGEKRRIKLLALLTMGVHLPGLEEWVEWEVRYKRVDQRMLEKTMPMGFMSALAPSPSWVSPRGKTTMRPRRARAVRGRRAARTTRARARAKARAVRAPVGRRRVPLRRRVA
ncbi:adenine nucleotide alpha hydrolases-like protein [Sodiomyces alkalinus F11]|uniref:tRNA(Ile)-lysidine synthetase n=1 Tax=Sodiomyces alkalinus (strain CBS 110278 / VKM F-3762 / F11) TaxID=1314773 RepID=A0A3N2PWB5_SODAK|nr:adenine nucleotide alpha hydrolases-like protein [Sodiomyces alkalinus F11]ROT38777.1 adenine nucleotide alpha hydrolases-like protein [Sodiomyces alkalinus F11]